MAKRRTKGQISARIEEAKRAALTVTTGLEIDSAPGRKTVRVGNVDPPATASDPKSVRLVDYTETCLVREAEREAHKNRRVVPFFKPRLPGKKPAATPLPLLTCPACGGDVPACRLCKGRGEVAASAAQAWYMAVYGEA